MNTAAQTATAAPGKAAVWTGRVASGLVIAFLTMDGVMKLFKPAVVVEGTTKLGWPVSTIVPLGIVLLAATALYLVPKTSVLGAILVTGYLGGAVGTHVRVGDPLFSHILFPVYLGILAWGGLYLRDLRVRALIPFRS